MLLALTPLVWAVWGHPLKWSPGMSLMMAAFGLVMPALGLAFLIGGKRFHDGVMKSLGQETNLPEQG